MSGPSEKVFVLYNYMPYRSHLVDADNDDDVDEDDDGTDIKTKRETTAQQD